MEIDNTIKLINENIVGASDPITDMAGIWNMLKNDNMTAHDRKMVLTEVDNLLTAAQPKFTQTQHNALNRCIANAIQLFEIYLSLLGPLPF